ncbi:MAG: hypothetical protein ABI857_01515 [Acidobacteriota bacterium]
MTQNFDLSPEAQGSGEIDRKLWKTMRRMRRAPGEEKLKCYKNKIFLTETQAGGLRVPIYPRRSQKRSMAVRLHDVRAEVALDFVPDRGNPRVGCAWSGTHPIPVGIAFGFWPGTRPWPARLALLQALDGTLGMHAHEHEVATGGGKRRPAAVAVLEAEPLPSSKH